MPQTMVLQGGVTVTPEPTTRPNADDHAAVGGNLRAAWPQRDLGGDLKADYDHHGRLARLLWEQQLAARRPPRRPGGRELICTPGIDRPPVEAHRDPHDWVAPLAPRFGMTRSNALQHRHAADGGQGRDQQTCWPDGLCNATRRLRSDQPRGTSREQPPRPSVSVAAGQW
jgi:hypothetical protein